MEVFQGVVLVAAVITAGLSAGFFYAFSHDIMPGLGGGGDRTFVGGFQAIDRAVINPLFMISYLGPLVLSGVAGALHLGADSWSVLVPVAVGFVLYVVMMVITARVHLPLNAQIKAAGDPDRNADLAGARERFETGWVRWNHVRTVLSLATFGCLTWALLRYGQLAG